uniref:Proteasome activator PA28 C-terminal domain-containing protein n=1 Tax=Gouania willdenowi TaxID=441366 RepID=A0A8C5DDU0_GOUWI
SKSKPKMSQRFHLSPQVEHFRLSLLQEVCWTFILVNNPFIDFKTDIFNPFSITDTTSLRSPLEIPIPDPPVPEDEEMETDENDEDEKKKKKKAPKCGFIKSNEKILTVVNKVKPEIIALRETILTVSCWIQHLIPKIEDGNDFGVAIQEKILERITAVKTKVDGFQANINKYFSERGDAVAKASKETHVMDYRTLVHEKDEAIYSDLRVIVLDIRGFYTELYDIVSKNLEKVTNPKGEEKPSMY